MQWKLYGYTQDDQRIVLWEGHSRNEIYESMGSSGAITAAALGCVTWEIKNEWSGHVSAWR